MKVKRFFCIVRRLLTCIEKSDLKKKVYVCGLNFSPIKKAFSLQAQRTYLSDRGYDPCPVAGLLEGRLEEQQGWEDRWEQSKG